jgi:hypothetical protein
MPTRVHSTPATAVPAKMLSTAWRNDGPAPPPPSAAEAAFMRAGRFYAPSADDATLLRIGRGTCNLLRGGVPQVTLLPTSPATWP